MNTYLRVTPLLTERDESRPRGTLRASETFYFMVTNTRNVVVVAERLTNIEFYFQLCMLVVVVCDSERARARAQHTCNRVLWHTHTHTQSVVLCEIICNIKSSSKHAQFIQVSSHTTRTKHTYMKEIKKKKIIYMNVSNTIVNKLSIYAKRNTKTLCENNSS